MLLTIVLGLVFLALCTLLVLWLLGERGHLILPSTLHALRHGHAEPAPSAPAGHHRPHWYDPLHAYVYGRWTNQYIGFLTNWLLPRLSPPARQKWADGYHGKVLTPELAAELIRLDHSVHAFNQEQIVPFPVARDIVLASPLAINLYECACRHARPGGGCKPTDVCLTIGGAGPDFLLDHNPQSARRISQAEALAILKAEHERGHLHSAWFKDVMGDRLFAICNCCKCCCSGIEMMNEYGVRAMASSGFVAAIDTSDCTACGACVDACPFDALTLASGGTEVDKIKCMGCGVCTSRCTFEAISLVRDASKPVPLDVRLLHS